MRQWPFLLLPPSLDPLASKSSRIREEIDGQPGDRYYSQGDLRASLGTRPGVGGSCIVSFNTKSAYTLAPLVTAMEQDHHAKVGRIRKRTKAERQRWWWWRIDAVRRRPVETAELSGVSAHVKILAEWV